MRYLIVTASVSTARPSLRNIVTVKDYDTDDDILDYFLDITCLDHLLDITINQYQKFTSKLRRKDRVRKINVAS